MVRNYRNVRELVRGLALLMRQRRETVAYVAAMLGVSSQHLYRVMNGERNPSINLLEQWAKHNGHRLDMVFVLSEAGKNDAHV